jgi:hypothetical protein
MTRTPRVVTALLASVAVAAVAAAPAMAGPSDKRAATKLLRGTVWTTYQSGNVTGASLDRSVTLCRDNTYVLVTSFVAPIIEDDSSYDHPDGQTRVTGTWRVKRAKLTRNRRYGTVHVAYTTDAGERGSVVLAANQRGATLAGVPAQVGRASTC